VTVNACSADNTMPIIGIDHFAILTDDAIATAEFYGFILGFDHGPRPRFNVPGIWLYCNDAPILHILEVSNVPTTSSALDHAAFRGSELAGLVERLSSRGIPYRLCRVPEGVAGSGAWQLFFSDLNGARVEVTFSADEPDPRGSARDRTAAAL
jgi:hypothetical protein